MPRCPASRLGGGSKGRRPQGRGGGRTGSSSSSRKESQKSNLYPPGKPAWNHRQGKTSICPSPRLGGGGDGFRERKDLIQCGRKKKVGRWEARKTKGSRVAKRVLVNPVDGQVGQSKDGGGARNQQLQFRWTQGSTFCKTAYASEYWGQTQKRTCWGQGERGVLAVNQ